MSSAKEINISGPITQLSGVGPQMAIKLERLHVHTIQDVLFHLPHRYEDRTKVTPMGALLPSISAVVIGQIDLAQVVFGRRRSLIVRISDGTGSITIRMFYFNRSQEKSFRNQKMQWSRAGSHNVLQIRTSMASKRWDYEWKDAVFEAISRAA